MSEPVSALPGASFDGFTRIEEAGPRGMITLRGDLSAKAVRDAATGIAGVEMPGQRGCNLAGEYGLAWMSPDELLVLLPHDKAEEAVATMQQTLGQTHSLAINVSDARAVFRLTGAGLREVLAKLAPVDMRRAAFGPGQIRRTRLAQVPAAFWMRDEESAELVCFRSHAAYVFGILSAAAAPGAEVNAGL